MDFRLKILDLRTFQQRHFSQSLKLLSPWEKIKYQSFGSEKRRQQWLAVRFLAYKKFGITQKIQYSSTGQPLLDCCKISISHTDQLVAVAISTGALGIDIERINRNFRRISVKFVSPNDPQNLSDLHLALLWTAKEAVYKLWAERELSFKQNIVLNLPEKLNSFGHFTGQIFKNGRNFPVAVSYYVFNQHFITIARYEST